MGLTNLRIYEFTNLRIGSDDVTNQRTEIIADAEERGQGVNPSIRKFANPSMHVSRPIRVLCVDDHRVMLDGLALLIGRQPDMEVIAAATLGEEAVDLFRRHRPDVTLMDLQL